MIEKKFIPLFLSILLCIIIPHSLYGFDYALGKGTYIMQSRVKPAKGVSGSFVDPNFHTTITRVTDASTDKPGTPYDWMRSTYATVPSSNCDGSYILVRAHAPADWIIYYGPNSATPYQYKQRIAAISASRIDSASEESPYWSMTDPDKLYVLRNPYSQFRADGVKFYYYKVSTDTLHLIHDFKDDPGISKFFVGIPVRPGQNSCAIQWGEYSGGTIPQRYWAFSVYDWKGDFGGGLVAAIIYDMQTDTIKWTEDPNKIYLHANKGVVAMSPSEKYLIARSKGAMTFNVLDLDLNVLRTSECWGHTDTALDADGRDVIFGEGLPGGDYIAMLDLESGATYGIANRPCSAQGYCSSVHYSGHSYSRPGWGIVSVENGISVTTGTPEWFESQIYMIELNRSKADWVLPYGEQNECHLLLKETVSGE